MSSMLSFTRFGAACLVWILMVFFLGTVPAGSAPVPSDDSARFEVLVLGIAQDGGLPHVGCEKSCCTTARAEGRSLYPASLGIHDRETGRLVLVEATPAIEQQLALLHRWTGQRERGRRPVDAVLLTHAHIGHYLGLAHLGREVASTERVPLFVSGRMARFLESNGPWDQLVRLEQVTIREIEPGVAFEPVPGLSVTAVEVPHRDEYSDTMAYRIAAGSSRVVFVPDIDAWSRAPGLLDRLLEGASVAYVDATFYDGRELPGRDLSEIPHPLMTDTMQRLEGWARQHPGAVRFIHLNHTNPALHDPAIRETMEKRGFRIAERGERVLLR